MRASCVPNFEQPPALLRVPSPFGRGTQEARRAGNSEASAMPFPARSLAENFWPKVEKRGPDECWIWQACICQRTGYGKMGAANPRRTLRAHVVAWIIENGPVPAGLCVLHSCDVRPCVNVRHLWLGTKAENSRDMVRKGRSVKGTRLHTVVCPMCRQFMPTNAARHVCPSSRNWRPQGGEVAPG